MSYCSNGRQLTSLVRRQRSASSFYDKTKQNESAEKQQDNTNDQEYEYEEDEYDDPNSDDYDGEEDENYNDQVPEPPISTKLNSNKNDTRMKRESIYDDPKKSGLHASNVKNVISRTSFSPGKFVLKALPLKKKISISEDASESPRSVKLLIPHLRLHDHIAHQKDLAVHRKESSLDRVFNSESETDNRRLRRSKRGRGENREEIEVFSTPEFSNNNRVHAAHFAADESKCKNTRHRHCDINDRRFHPQNHLKDWQSPLWMNLLAVSSSFDMNDGVLTIQQAGIYFIYAQVFYADAHDVCGFRVYQNNQPILQCTTTTVHDSSKHMHKRNSCFTGSLIHLQTGDQLTLRETEENRYTFFERTKSFFGLFKIGNT